MQKWRRTVPDFGVSAPLCCQRGAIAFRVVSVRGFLPNFPMANVVLAAKKRDRPAHLRDLALGALLVVATFIAYLPALHGGLLLDDNLHVTAPALQSLHGLKRIWFDVGATQQYYPLLHTAFWLEHHLWGGAVAGYHLINVLLHAAAAVLLVALVRRLRLPGAWLAGFIFALHPVGVESVAWIAEQKNTLSTVFYLGSALAYLRFDRGRAPGRYALAFGLFVLALLSKTSTATLPAALLVVLWWQRGRLAWKGDVLPLVPWLVVACAAGLVTESVEGRLIGGLGGTFSLTGLDRCLLAGRIIWFYLAKLAWPADLTFFIRGGRSTRQCGGSICFPWPLWRWRPAWPGSPGGGGVHWRPCCILPARWLPCSASSMSSGSCFRTSLITSNTSPAWA